MNHAAFRSPSRSQRGMSLIEVMVSVTIALFMAIGLSVVYVSTKRAFTSQDDLSQLQDNERLALTVLTNAVQIAGYYPDPQATSIATRLPPLSGTYGDFAEGAGVVGTTGTGTGTAGDTLTVRYVSASGDGLRDCFGGTNTTGTTTTTITTFSVSSASELMCSINGSTPTAVVSNVSNLSVLYGTDTASNGSAYRYLTATAVRDGGYWPQVKTVRMTINFINPFARDTGQPATIEWIQIVSVKNRT